MWNFGVSDISWNIDKMGSIGVIELSNLDLKMVVLMLNGISHFCLSQFFLESSLYVVHKLIALIICCSQLFKMVSLSPFWNAIKTGDHWTLKSFLIFF